MTLHRQPTPPSVQVYACGAPDAPGPQAARQRRATQVTPVASYECGRGGHDEDMTDEKAAEAREGLFDSVAGKAKEVAGAVTGKDELVEEGQLQQAEAGHRRSAVADEAVADAKREEASQEIREAEREAAQQKGSAQAAAARQEGAVEQQRAAQHAAAEREAEAVEVAAARGRRAARRPARRPAPRRGRGPEVRGDRRRARGRRRAAAPRARGRRRRPAGRAAARPDREVRTTMISTLISLPYEAARLPLRVVDGLAARLPETSAPRVAWDRALGTADRTAGGLLHHPGIAQRGTDRLERTEKLVTAARLEQEAAARREQARETAAAGRQEAQAKREAAKDRVSSGLDEAQAVEAKGTAEAVARADRAEAARKAAADAEAERREEAIEERTERVASAAEARKRAAQEAPKNELDEARETKQAAEQARADAERLSDLTEAKKEQREDSSTLPRGATGATTEQDSAAPRPASAEPLWVSEIGYGRRMSILDSATRAPPPTLVGRCCAWQRESSPPGRLPSPCTLEGRSFEEPCTGSAARRGPAQSGWTRPVQPTSWSGCPASSRTARPLPGHPRPRDTSADRSRTARRPAVAPRRGSGGSPVSRSPLRRRRFRRPLTTLLPYRTPSGPVLLSAAFSGHEQGAELAWAIRFGPWKTFAALSLDQDPVGEADRPVARSTRSGMDSPACEPYGLGIRRLREPFLRHRPAVSAGPERRRTDLPTSPPPCVTPPTRAQTRLPKATTSTTLTGTATAARLPMCATGQARIATRTSTPCHRWPSLTSAHADQGERQREEQAEGLDQVGGARLVDQLGVARATCGWCRSRRRRCRPSRQPGQQDPGGEPGVARQPRGDPQHDEPVGDGTEHVQHARRWRRPSRGRRTSSPRPGRSAVRRAARRSAADRSGWSSVSRCWGGWWWRSWWSLPCRWHLHRRPPRRSRRPGDNPGSEKQGKPWPAPARRRATMSRVTRTDPRGLRGLLPLLLVSVVVVLVAIGLSRGLWLANLHNGLLALALHVRRRLRALPAARAPRGLLFMAAGSSRP